MRSVNPRHKSVVLGPGLCYRGSDTLCLPPSQPLVETRIYFARESREGRRACCCAGVSLRFIPGGSIPLSLPSQKFAAFHTNLK